MRLSALSWLFAFLLTACGRAASPEPTPTPDPLVARGRQVFQQNCATCHATDPDTVILGPSLAGIAGRAANRVSGLDARQYIEQSVLAPDNYLVEGFVDLMPKDFGRKLTGEELDALIMYLMTLER